ncbi:MAG: hypothetical protein ACYDCH_09310 [Gaiellaceae bacterium]
MRRLLTAAALVVLVAAPAALGSRDPWAGLRRPLRLAPLAAGASCPVTARRPLDRNRLSGLGAGPAYPLPVSFSRYDRRPAWLGAKTIWAWPPALKTRATRILVRGRRLDAAGPLRFQLGPGWDTAPLTTELRLDTTQTVGAFTGSTWGTTVTMLLVRSPGCYGLQLDTARGSTTIVIAATG